MKIKTERLILRNYKMSDIEDYWEYVSQPNVGPRCGWPVYTDKQEAVKRLQLETTKPLQFCIEYQKKVIGSIEVFNVEEKDGKKICELGILLNENFWGKGIMTEAMKAIVKLCFDHLGIDVVTAGFFEPNIGSWRVQEKCGFKQYKTTPNFTKWYLTGEDCACIGTKIEKEDYLKIGFYKDFKMEIVDKEKKL